MDEADLRLLHRLAERHGINFTNGAAPAQRAFKTAEGLGLSYLDWGGDGPPALFLHGGALTGHTWDLVCLGLRDDFHCVALDLRGHGDSGWTDDYRIGASVTDVAALASHLGWGPFHLMGMSLGGNIAGHYAAAHGGLLSLTFVDVGPHVDFAASARMRGFISGAGPAPTVEALVDAAMTLSPHSDRDTVLYRYRHSLRRTPEGFVWKRDQRRPHDYPHIIAKLDELEHLAGAIACPMLIARGGRSRIYSDDKAAAFAARFPDGRWTAIDGAGHNVQEDNPKALAAAFRELAGG
jgi:pimeloyl-ACP methyl ester carboxylesterase